jgi:hypothetical protein
MPQIPQIVSVLQSMAWEPHDSTNLFLYLLRFEQRIIDICYSQFQAILVPSQDPVHSGFTSTDIVESTDGKSLTAKMLVTMLLSGNPSYFLLNKGKQCCNELEHSSLRIVNAS